MHQIGSFQVLDVLGEGSLGIVYRGRHVRTGEDVAVKTVSAPTEDSLAAIRREIRALSRLNHPGIIRIVDNGIENGIPWYAMELVEGISLKLRAAQKGFDFPWILTIFRRICSALAYMHGEGFLHRDLKPENILISVDERPVISDFGLAAAGIHWQRAGTVSYMAPECFLGSTPDPRSDLYAVGCMLYEMVYGRPPFSEGSTEEIMWKHFHEIPRIDPGEPAGDLLFRLLAKKPEDRPAYAQDLARELERLGAEPVEMTEPAPRTYLYQPRFVGRAGVFHRLNEQLQNALDGTGSAALVGGTSGAGKSRLSMELAREASGRQLYVLKGECAPEGAPGGAASLHPFRTILEAMADRSRGDPAAAEEVFGHRIAVLALLQPSLSSLPLSRRYSAPAELPAEAAKTRLYAYLSETLEAFAHDNPFLLVLDDLHWADDLTLDFLHFWFHSASFRKTPCFFLGTYRVEECGPGIRSLLKIPQLCNIQLEPLDRAALVSMLQDMLALPEPSPGLVDRLEHYSEGNPFYALEYLRAAVECGLVRRDSGGRWQVDGQIADLPMPGSIRDAVEQRISRITRQAQELLEAAAVWGREIDLSGLSILGRDHDVDAMQELIGAQILQETGMGRLRIAHDRIREVAYERIPDLRRKALHRAAALYLQSRGSAEASVIAYHWKQCGHHDLARSCYLAAARTAMGRSLFGEARISYRSYLNLVTEPSPESIDARNEYAAEVLGPEGESEDAIREHETALAEAKQIGHRPSEGSSLTGLCKMYRIVGRMDRARKAGQNALKIHRRCRNHNAVGMTLLALATVEWNESRMEEARRHLEEAIAIHDRHGTERNLGIACNVLAVIHMDQGRLGEAQALFERALSVSRKIGDKRTEGVIYNNLANIRWPQGKIHEARMLYEQALAIHRETGDRRSEGATLSNIGFVLGEQGYFDEALAVYRQAADILRRIGDLLNETHALANMAVLYRRTGQLRMAEESNMQARRVFLEIANAPGLLLCCCEAGHIALANGASAQPALEQARAYLSQVEAAATSESGKAVQRLERSVQVAKKGKRLFRGESIDDLSDGLRAYLLETGQIEIT